MEGDHDEEHIRHHHLDGCHTPARPGGGGAVTVQFEDLANNAMLSGTCPVRISAADDLGITSITFYRFDLPYKTFGYPDAPTVAQAQLDWDTAWVGDCDCTITAVARNTKGAEAKSELSVTIFNDDPPPAPPGYPARRSPPRSRM